VRDPEGARKSIMEATERLLRRSGDATVDQVAREADCAKGLIHYHFRTKDELFSAVLTGVSERRRRLWMETLRTETPHSAIERSWQLLVDEHRTGLLRLWTALLAGRVTGHTVNNQVVAFATTVSEATAALLTSLGLEPAIPAEELGLYLAAVVHGTGFQLEAGVGSAELQGSYAAAWLGVLSLTRPSTT
jgi:AcrR family transcriptional regulator